MTFAWIPMNLLKPTLNMYSLLKVLTKLKKMFILILELNNIFKFNISKHISQLLFIYATRNICSLLYHVFTHLANTNVCVKRVRTLFVVIALYIDDYIIVTNNHKELLPQTKSIIQCKIWHVWYGGNWLLSWNSH